MKNTNDSVIKKYVKEVLQLTPGTYRFRLKKELTSSICEHFHDMPEVTQSMLHECFGTPQIFAANYLSSMDPDELQAHLARTNKQKKHLLVALICLLLLLIPIGIWIFSEEERHKGNIYAVELFDFSTQQQQFNH